MKQIIVGGLALLALIPTVGYTADCKPVAEYKVGYTSYKARTLSNSLQHVLRGTPYKANVESGGNTNVKAKRISGALTQTLDNLAQRSGTQWRQEGCLIRFSGKQAVQATEVSATPVGIATAAAPATSSAPAVIAKAAEAPAKPAQVWRLQADQPIHKQFAEWARQAGWTFEWRLEKSWLVPAATQFTGSFDDALARAVEALYMQGKPVRLILWEGNRFAEIVDVDAK